jgi:hypothetical protein
MWVYITYPNRRIEIHKNVSCSEIQKQQKVGQRIIKINPSTLKSVLSQFINDAFKFESKPQSNDMWLNISLSTIDQEMGTVHVIQALLGQRYTPLSDAPIKIHCS